MFAWNPANAARACRAGLIGFVLVILSASLAKADFGPRTTTLGTNYQQSSSTKSPDGVNAGDCSGGSQCQILFQPIPQQQPLIVQHVSCTVGVTTTGELLLGSLWTRKGDTFPIKWTFLIPVQTYVTRWVINSPVMHLLKSGERPQIRFFNSANAEWGAECNISGQLQQP